MSGPRLTDPGLLPRSQPRPLGATGQPENRAETCQRCGLSVSAAPRPDHPLLVSWGQGAVTRLPG